MASRVYQSGAVVIHSLEYAPAARVYQSGAVVIHTIASGGLTLSVEEAHPGYSDLANLFLIVVKTVSIAEDSNNYADAVALQLNGVFTLDLSENTDNYADNVTLFAGNIEIIENINNWADSVGTRLNMILQVSDGLPAWSDKVTLLYVVTLAAGEDINNLQDEITSFLAGLTPLTPTESISFSDNLGMVLNGRVQVQEAWNNFLADKINMVLSKHLSTVAETIPTPTDSVSLNLVAPLTLSVGEDANNYSDAVTVGTDSRGVGASRVAMSDYIRRYLNDVES